ncbi:Uncharacterised protein [Vibrio cholerae]|nr:Uncharacterised protein [Vibrio cholerae]
MLQLDFQDRLNHPTTRDRTDPPANRYTAR